MTGRKTFYEYSLGAYIKPLREAYMDFTPEGWEEPIETLRRLSGAPMTA